MLAAATETFGGLDILILDAAYNKWIPFPDLQTLDAENWNYIMNFNLTAPYLAARSAAPLMKKRGGGRIVTITSIGGLQPQASSIAYAVSKAALIHLSKCLAVALAPEILVNNVAPGLMDGTLMTDNLSPEYAQKSRDSALLKKAAGKDDVAAAVTLMCKTDSITGQTLVVDAGKYFH
jgi:3-oxoacyl-[acyl-carrier protein] reductase